MYKWIASIRKEFLVLINDKVGLALMFGLPIALVFLMTIIQDSAYKIVNENNVDILITNRDLGNQGDKFVHLIRESKAFNIEITTVLIG